MWDICDGVDLTITPVQVVHFPANTDILADWCCQDYFQWEHDPLGKSLYSVVSIRKHLNNHFVVLPRR